jgi:site-specific recombinase XerD
MATTSYLLTKGQNSSGESQIILRTYVRHGHCIRIQSGIWLNPKRWGKKNGITIPTTPGDEQEELIRKRELLKRLTAWIEDEIKTVEDKETIDSKWGEKMVRRFYKPAKAPKEREKSFLDVIEIYLATNKLSPYRINNFRVLARCLGRFELYRKKENSQGFKLTFPNISPEVLRQIEYFLADETVAFKKYPEIYERIPYSAKPTLKTPARKRPPILDKADNVVPKGMPKPRGQNTVADMMTRFRAFTLWAIDNGYTSNNPFKRYVIGEIVYGSPIYITNEERNQLLETDMSDDPEVELHRDIFVFQCLIGCRVSDLFKMTYQSIINGAVEYIPRKTRDGRPITVRVPLNETGKRLIAKYKDNSRGSIFPFETTQHYNRKIKDAFRRAGLDRMVTVLDQQTRQEQYVPLCDIASSHMARRTFVGNIYKKVKDPNLVGALSGHKEGSKAFARYRTIDDDMKKELIGHLD